MRGACWTPPTPRCARTATSSCSRVSSAAILKAMQDVADLLEQCADGEGSSLDEHKDLRAPCGPRPMR